MAKIKEFRTVDFPEYDKKFADLLASKLPFAKSKEALLKEELGAENYEIFEQAKRMTQRKGAQALLPVKIDIH